VELKQLLWVRCRNIDQALRATDLLLQGRGFGLIAVDLSDIPQETIRHVPLHVWFRFRRAVEDSPTVLMLLEQESNAKTCASLVLRLGAERAHWSLTPGPDTNAAHFLRHPAACLFDSLEARAEVLSCRMEPSANEIIPASQVNPAGIFAGKARWGYCSGVPMDSMANQKAKSKVK
jgi:hypothetical protein